MKTISPAASNTPSRAAKVSSLVLRFFACTVFLSAGGAKLAGVPMMVEIFDHIGIGQWFRILTGVIEVMGGLAILSSASSVFAALLLAVTMFVAILVHLFVIGGSPVPAIVLLIVTATITWLHRGGFATALGRA